ncbi:acetyl/propionyl/methylcrotonyl-CoA carboxylase subunit alpha [Litorimonas sp. RW-G-Af-16]|uniref:acetyl/propionyl/methylcrotonyl-CoA carboxylase subunit alpha n=1 Tax=Litorimonas sp. RW-G-Af-16 TaxID=3241168 RepID=UPI00390CC4DA
MTKTITKILIANRGEIACRVIKTARDMGIATVAVYSDADRKALHVQMADEAVHIGPSPANESYLVIENIIAAAKDTGADAVHPGYGFLSENPGFVRACEKAGLIFIGPSADAMEAMGLKDAAKKLMDKAGVPTTPGYHGKDQDLNVLRKEADKIGYPVLIKAVAGGGGKGMRKVDAAADFEASLASCQREAKSSFGNDAVLIEKYIQSPRHIEVQVFGDAHGHVVHMFERDCSLQRRHQKVIEEAPAPGMTDAVRTAMTDAAIKAAKAVNYVGAGTVEFIVDGSGELRTDGFWFMEMNTRLQVEHPVSEMITGLDLVEWQIRVAQGEKLPKQSDIKMSGHAIEARLYAEDPANDFLPSVGQLDVFHPSLGALDGSYRLDTGVQKGSEISIYYDPMIGKFIAHATTRNKAIQTLTNSLRTSYVYPVKTNKDFLIDCLNEPAFKNAAINTNFIAEYLSNWSRTEPLSRTALRSLAIHIYQHLPKSDNSPFSQTDGWRLNGRTGPTLVYYVNGEAISFHYSHKANGLQCEVLGKVKTSLPTDPRDVYETAAPCFDLRNDAFVIMAEGGPYQITRKPPTQANAAASSHALTASMPGKIISVNATAGDSVKEGEALIVMEAMKMEMTLNAPRDGIVSDVTCAEGSLVTDGEILLTLEKNN